ncbi:7582_t:CDS:2, partial [Paraglomus brasilianum]
MAKILRCPGCNREIRTAPIGNPPIQNPAENPTPTQNIPPAEYPIQTQNQAPVENPAPTPEGDLISFDENPPTHQPTQPREASAPAVNLLTDGIPNTEAGSSSNTQGEQKKKSILTIDELIKWLSKPEIKNNKKIRSKPIPKTGEEWYDLMEIDNEKDSEPSDDVEHRSSASSEYDTAEEEPDIYFERIKDPYINRKSEAEIFNEGEVCDYYAFVPKGYYAENEPLGFFESIEEKIAN